MILYKYAYFLCALINKRSFVLYC